MRRTTPALGIALLLGWLAGCGGDSQGPADSSTWTISKLGHRDKRSPPILCLSKLQFDVRIGNQGVAIP
jgi:hypothetical protein